MKYLWLMLLLFISTLSVAQALPEAPTPQPERATFFTFRTSYEAPALKPNKKSWAIFAASHAIAWGALAAASHTKEPWESEAPAMAGVTAMDFLAFKLFSPSFSIGAPIYATQHYLRAR